MITGVSRSRRPAIRLVALRCEAMSADPRYVLATESNSLLLYFDAFQTPTCFVGHTHVPALYYLPSGAANARQCEMRTPQWNSPVHINSGRLIANPGSVGQPRDGNPAASYALFDLDNNTWEHRRVRYPVRETQSRMRERDLPARLVERLAQGH